MQLRVVLLAIAAAHPSASSTIHVPAGARSFTIMHVSDAHFHNTSCEDLPPGYPYPCSFSNTTRLLQSIASTDRPDMIAFTGDIVDANSHPPQPDMDLLYGVAISNKLSWGASLGNHDEESTLSRDQVVEYIEAMPGNPLTSYGPVRGSPGNFHVDIGASNGHIAARLVFFDSRIDTVNVSINDAQLAWFNNLTKTLPPAPTLAFYHIPLEEYKDAINAKTPISGSMHEPICADKPNSKVFAALKAAGVLVGFCGHDHTNDFCVSWQGVQLCYEGSAGYTAYGNAVVQRRTRITKLQLGGDGELLDIVSYKRVDAGGSMAGAAIDREVLWSHNASETARDAARRVSLTPDHLASLGPARSQPK